MEKIKSFFGTPEELYVGAFLQFPLYFIIGWKILLIMPITALLWRFGGWEHGSKWARKLGVPLIVCVATLLANHHVAILLAVPFMAWWSPFSYGESGWLKKLLKKDILIREVTYFWYWLTFSIAFCLKLF